MHGCGGAMRRSGMGLILKPRTANTVTNLTDFAQNRQKRLPVQLDTCQKQPHIAQIKVRQNGIKHER